MSNLINCAMLPQTPGVYFFQDARGANIYIGKAKNLKMRLSSYFQKNSALTPAKKRMLAEARSLHWQETPSETEALILESGLIKKYRPKYNIVMRDDKNYSFVGFSRGQFPRVFVTHQPIGDGNFIGPFTDGTALKSALRTLRAAFPYCVCKEKHKRPCVSYQIKRCPGVCCMHSASSWPDDKRRALEKEYAHNIRAIKNILAGKKQNIKNALEREMKKLSLAQQYEQASVARDKISALEKIFRHKNTVSAEIDIVSAKALTQLKTVLKLKDIPERIESYDISNTSGKQPVGSMVVFENGKPAKNLYRKFRIKTVRAANDPAMMAEIVSRRLDHAEWPGLDLIVLDGGITQVNAVKKVLSAKKSAIPLIGYAKKSDTIILSGKKIPVASLPPQAANLLKQMIAEAHRFAVSFHRMRRRKALLI